MWIHHRSIHSIVLQKGISGVDREAAYAAIRKVLTRLPDVSAELVAAMQEPRAAQYEIWLRDLGDRPFPYRAWGDFKTPLGDDNMWPWKLTL